MKILNILADVLFALTGVGLVVQAGYLIQNHRGLFSHYNKKPDSHQKLSQVSEALAELPLASTSQA
jgi:hypothetical protein